MPLPDLTQQSYQNATGSATSSDWWGQNAPPAAPAASPTGAMNGVTPNYGAGTGGSTPAAGPAGTPGAGGVPQWKPGDDPKVSVNQYIQQTQGRPANESDFSYWLPKFQAVGGLGTGEYWMHKMTDPSGTGGNQGDAGGGFGGGGYGSFSSGPGTFQAPSGLDMSNDPGYMARMKMGTDALMGSAAARGSLLSGGTLKALERYGQDYGSNEYGNVYGRALTGYQTNVGTQRNAQGDYWNRLQNLYAGGQSANQQTYQKP